MSKNKSNYEEDNILGDLGRIVTAMHKIELKSKDIDAFRWSFISTVNKQFDECAAKIAVKASIIDSLENNDDKRTQKTARRKRWRANS